MNYFILSSAFSFFFRAPEGVRWWFSPGREAWERPVLPPPGRSIGLDGRSPSPSQRLSCALGAHKPMERKNRRHPLFPRPHGLGYTVHEPPARKGTHIFGEYSRRCRERACPHPLGLTAWAILFTSLRPAKEHTFLENIHGRRYQLFSPFLIFHPSIFYIICHFPPNFPCKIP